MTPTRLATMITEHSRPYMTEMFRDHEIRPAAAGAGAAAGMAAGGGMGGGRDA